MHSLAEVACIRQDVRLEYFLGNKQYFLRIIILPFKDEELRFNSIKHWLVSEFFKTILLLVIFFFQIFCFWFVTCSWTTAMLPLSSPSRHDEFLSTPPPSDFDFDYRSATSPLRTQQQQSPPYRLPASAVSLFSCSFRSPSSSESKTQRISSEELQVI